MKIQSPLLKYPVLQFHKAKRKRMSLDSRKAEASRNHCPPAVSLPGTTGGITAPAAGQSGRATFGCSVEKAALTRRHAPWVLCSRDIQACKGFWAGAPRGATARQAWSRTGTVLWEDRLALSCTIWDALWTQHFHIRESVLHTHPQGR